MAADILASTELTAKIANVHCGAQRMKIYLTCTLDLPP